MSVIDSAKDIYDLLKKGATLELQEKLMRLREDALALQEENITLKENLQKAESELSKRQQLSFENDVYWTKDAEGAKTGLFCPICHDASGKLIRLHSTIDRMAQTDWICLKRERTFGKFHGN